MDQPWNIGNWKAGERRHLVLRGKQICSDWSVVEEVTSGRCLAIRDIQIRPDQMCTVYDALLMDRTWDSFPRISVNPSHVYMMTSNDPARGGRILDVCAGLGGFRLLLSI